MRNSRDAEIDFEFSSWSNAVRRIGFSALAALLALLLVRPAAGTPDSSDWTQTEKQFRQLFAQPGEAEGKIALVTTVVKDDQPRAWKLLADGLLMEATHSARTADHLAKALAELQVLLGKAAKIPSEWTDQDRLEAELIELEKARADDNHVVEAMILKFGATNEAGRRQILALTKGHKDFSVRAIGARVAVLSPDEELAKGVIAEALAAKEDARVKCAVLDALKTASGSSASWQDLVVARIEDPDWGVEILAARVAGKRKLGKAIPALIKALGTSNPRVSQEVVAALREITGQSIDAYAEPWGAWWEAHRSEWGADGRPLQPVVQQPRPADIKFYGIEIKSNRVMFIIDTSGSMKEAKQAPAAPPAKPKGPVTGEGKPPPEPEGKFSGPKIEIAKQELARAVKKLPKEAFFDIIAFNHGVFQWQPKMVQATEKMKEEAFAWIRDMEPKGSTYIDGALQMAFKMAGMGATDKAYAGVGVDTIMLLSDGAPTDNQFPESKNMDPDVILGHVREWNSQSRVIINCIGIDNVVQGIEFMKKLAAQNGGTYVDG
jgi:hypothetical protein